MEADANFGAGGLKVIFTCQSIGSSSACFIHLDYHTPYCDHSTSCYHTPACSHGYETLMLLQT